MDRYFRFSRRRCLSASGFIILSYGVIHAFLTTGSFTQVYSQAELFEKLREEKQRTEEALFELQGAHQKLEVLASTDWLTGAANRREFEIRGKIEIERAKRNNSALSFVLIDLDHFKQLNDRHGHVAGDEILKEFITLMKGTLRPSDLIGRVGGEEFAIMMPDTKRDDAIIMAERLRQITENKVITLAESEIRFTASFGVSEYGADGETYESVFGVADKRMYRAKHDGRNKVFV